MRCDQCEHWFVETRDGCREWEAESAGFGECKAVRERWVIQDEATAGETPWYQDDAEDARERWSAKRLEALKSAKAYVQDGSEYRAELFTAPDFFCALFTEKPHRPTFSKDQPGHE